MENGEPGAVLVAWLNEQPKTKEAMAAYFGGRKITEQNLSEWRGGGHQDWLAQEAAAAEVEGFAEAAQKLAESADGRLTDHLSTVLAARYATLLANWKGEVTREFLRKLEVLRALRKDVVALRRSEHDDIKVTMAQQRFEWDTERFDWEAEKAGEDSLDREFARKEKYQEKIRHIKRLMELNEIFSKPPPPEYCESGARCEEAGEGVKNKGVESEEIQGNPTKSNLVQGGNGTGKLEEVKEMKSLRVEEAPKGEGIKTSNIQRRTSSG